MNGGANNQVTRQVTGSEGGPRAAQKLSWDPLARFDKDDRLVATGARSSPLPIGSEMYSRSIIKQRTEKPPPGPRIGAIRDATNPS